MRRGVVPPEAVVHIDILRHGGRFSTPRVWVWTSRHHPLDTVLRKSACGVSCSNQPSRGASSIPLLHCSAAVIVQHGRFLVGALCCSVSCSVPCLSRSPVLRRTGLPPISNSISRAVRVTTSTAAVCNRSSVRIQLYRYSNSSLRVLQSLDWGPNAHSHAFSDFLDSSCRKEIN